MSAREATQRFECFGSTCAVLVSSDAHALDATRLARAKLEEWHERFSRFLPSSELSRLNEDPRETVPVSALMACLASAIVKAGLASGGLVDGTLLDQIERAGYVRDLTRPVPLALALALAPARKPASPDRIARWRQIEVDMDARTITRPPGVKLDSGGLAKGLFADVLAKTLARHASVAIDCAGDLLVGGAAAEPREIHVQSPFDESTLHTFRLASTGVATSGIGRRSWLDRDGRPAHHLLDPATGEPAFTGVVQATALAPSALAAEVYAKAALLSGPAAARRWLAHGGVLVLDDGSHRVIEPPPRTLSGAAGVSSSTSGRGRLVRSGHAQTRSPAQRFELASAGGSRASFARASATSRDNASDARDPDRQRDRPRERARARRGARA
jgi:thiamine biosynthesis lipoprotein